MTDAQPPGGAVKSQGGAGGVKATERRVSVEESLSPHPSMMFSVLLESMQGEKGGAEVQQIERNPDKKLAALAGDVYISPHRLTTLKLLGEGGFCTVEHCLLDATVDKAGEDVAVKKLRPEVMDNETDLREFIQEANVLRRLTHKGIVQFMGVGWTDTGSLDSMRRSMYIVEEYFQGGTLKGKIVEQMRHSNQVVYSGANALVWSVQVADALAFLHAQRPIIIHRDMKPELLLLLPEGWLQNILLSSIDRNTSTAALADFGLHKCIRARRTFRSAATAVYTLQRLVAATNMEQEKENDSTNAAVSDAQPPDVNITATDTSMLLKPAKKVTAVPDRVVVGQAGSYMYMAPEVFNGQEYNEKVDVFSMGVILYELFRRRPNINRVALDAEEEGIAEEEALEAYARKVASGFREPIPGGWPEPLVELVEACWDQQPSARPRMARVLDALQRMQRDDVFAAQDERQLLRAEQNYNAMNDCGCCALM